MFGRKHKIDVTDVTKEELIPTDTVPEAVLDVSTSQLSDLAVRPSDAEEIKSNGQTPLMLPSQQQLLADILKTLKAMNERLEDLVVQGNRKIRVIKKRK